MADDTAAGASPPARLTIHRTSPDDLTDRQVLLSLDGRHVATLVYGQRITLPVEPGRHTLRANNTLVWRTVEFDISPGERVQFAVVNKAPPYLSWMIGLLGVGPIYVTLRREAPDGDA